MEYKKNDIVTLTIEDIGTDGEGIGKTEGFTLFVKDAVIGDIVEARILKAKKNYAYARLEKVITPSPFRIEPVCACHKQCGGCQIQAFEYERQLLYKHNKVRNNLIRLGGFGASDINEAMEPIVGMEEPFRYRNKAQYPVGIDKDGNLITGFYAGRTHSIIANTECYLGTEENKVILESILAYMKDNHVSAYEEETGKGLVRHVLIRKGFTSKEIMVCLVMNADGAWQRGKQANEAAVNLEFLPNQGKLTERLAKIEGMTSVSVSLNPERTNVIMGKSIHTIWGKDTISDTIHIKDMGEAYRKCVHDDGRKESLTFKISPLSFYQVNPVQTEKLYSLALEYAGLKGKETVWDLYCGIGTISLFMATKAKKVYGVEIIPQAIEDAKHNAACNGIDNVEFFVGKAEEVLPAKYEQDGMYADVIVVDPPRKGCDEACLSTMLKMAPKRIVYVSCDPATLARDLRVLCDGGYEIQRLRAVDLFPQTTHIECVVALTRIK